MSDISPIIARIWELLPKVYKGPWAVEKSKWPAAPKGSL